MPKQKYVSLFEKFGWRAEQFDDSSMMSDQIEMPQDGLKKAFNEQPRAMLTHFALSHSLVVCNHRKNAKQIVPEDNSVIQPLGDWAKKHRYDRQWRWQGDREQVASHQSLREAPQKPWSSLQLYCEYFHFNFT